MDALPQTRTSLVHDLRALGLCPGVTVLLHASLRCVGWVCGGAPTVVRAAIGARGELTARHPLTSEPGEESPLAALEAADETVLLRGVGFERCTAFHLGEYRQPGAIRLNAATNWSCCSRHSL